MLSLDDNHPVHQCKQVMFPHSNSMGQHKVSIQIVHKYLCVLCALGTVIAGEKESGAMVLSLEINSAGVLIYGLPNFHLCVLPTPV